MSDDAQLRAVLRSTVEFLHSQGCGEASSAVQETLWRLDYPSPLKWELKDQDGGEWRIELVDVMHGYGQIRRLNPGEQ